MVLINLNSRDIKIVHRMMNFGHMIGPIIFEDARICAVNIVDGYDFEFSVHYCD